MHKLLERLVIRALRVPPEPHPPAGSPGSVRVFRASKNFYYYNLFGWALKQIGAVIGIIAVLTMFTVADVGGEIPWDVVPLPEDVGEEVDEMQAEMAERPIVTWFLTSGVMRYVEAFGILIFLVQIPITYTMVRMDYEMRWYIATDRSLRIREGIASVREMTMTFANVQNLTIEQGPVQRLLKISDLRVRTAGGGSGDSDSEEGKGKGEHSLHLGYLRGVDNAQEIRDTILDRLRRLKDSGLGDPDDIPVPADPDRDPAGSTLLAARDLLRETRALRRVLG